MNKYLFILSYLLCFFLSVLNCYADTGTSITKDGVTFTFQDTETYGQFINGDYWVVGPVTIISITPSYSNGDNGWQVNPTINGTEQGYDDTCDYGTFNSSLIPSLPYTSSTSESIVKSVSSGSGQSCIQTFVVLTVVPSVPANNGAYTFRPAYFGTDKTQYTTSDLHEEYWPSYTDPNNGNTPTLSTVEGWFSKLRYDINTGGMGRCLRPVDATGVADGYQPEIIKHVIEGGLRVMLSDGKGTQAYYNFLQYCLDMALAVAGGFRGGAGGGHYPGFYTIAAIGAAMFNISATKTALATGTNFYEGKYIQWNHDSTKALWGETTTTETQYWNYIRGLGGGRSAHDPYGYIDGGKCTDSDGYQYIVSQAFKGEALITHLMPELQNVWDSDLWSLYSNYADRIVNTGLWCRQADTGDPCAPYTAGGTYEVDYGPNGQGGCIQDGGRSTDYGSADGGQYKSLFVKDMWDNYRDNPWSGNGHSMSLTGGSHSITIGSGSHSLSF